MYRNYVFLFLSVGALTLGCESEAPEQDTNIDDGAADTTSSGFEGCEALQANCPTEFGAEFSSAEGADGVSCSCTDVPPCLPPNCLAEEGDVCDAFKTACENVVGTYKEHVDFQDLRYCRCVRETPTAQLPYGDEDNFECDYMAAGCFEDFGEEYIEDENVCRCLPGDLCVAPNCVEAYQDCSECGDNCRCETADPSDGDCMSLMASCQGTYLQVFAEGGEVLCRCVDDGCAPEPCPAGYSWDADLCFCD